MYYSLIRLNVHKYVFIQNSYQCHISQERIHRVSRQNTETECILTTEDKECQLAALLLYHFCCQLFFIFTAFPRIKLNSRRHRNNHSDNTPSRDVSRQIVFEHS